MLSSTETEYGMPRATSGSKPFNSYGPFHFSKPKPFIVPSLRDLAPESDARKVAEALIRLSHRSGFNFAHVLRDTTQTWFGSGTTLLDWGIGKAVARRELGVTD